MKETRLSVKQIADIIGGTVCGDAERIISGVSGIEEAKAEHITFVANIKYASFIESTNAGCIIVDPNIETSGKTAICVSDVYLAISKLLPSFCVSDEITPGVAEHAFVGKNCDIAAEVSIMPFAYIGNGCKIGRGTTIYSGVHIGDGSVIGENVCIHPNVSIYRESNIGNNVIIHAGSVIGSDGFGYAQVASGSVKIPQIGNVVIEEDVEIGSNVTIDRGTIGSTIICAGSKIDNLVQIGHNVEIGEKSVIISQVGISGSTKIGKRVFLGGQVGVVGHISIGDFSKIAAKSGISKSVPKNSIWGGEVGQPIMDWKRSHALIKRLPNLQNKVRELKKKLQHLEEKLDENY